MTINGSRDQTCILIAATPLVFTEIVAEGVGFEPTVRFPARQFSRLDP
jgi:hypothetical protein